MEDEERFHDEDRQFTGPEGAERGEDEDARIAAPESPAGVDEDDVTGEGLRRSGGLEERLEQEESGRPGPRRPAVEEPEDVGWRASERDEAGRLVREGPGITDREKDEVAQEADPTPSSPSAEEAAVRVEEGDPPGAIEEEGDPYVEEP